MKLQKNRSQWAILVCAFALFAPQASHASGAADATKVVSAYSAAVNTSTKALLKAANDVGLRRRARCAQAGLRRNKPLKQNDRTNF